MRTRDCGSRPGADQPGGPREKLPAPESAGETACATFAPQEPADPGITTAPDPRSPRRFHRARVLEVPRRPSRRRLLAASGLHCGAGLPPAGLVPGAARGVVLILVTLLLLVIVPLMGLAIDGVIMYLLKARLSQAVDAACLAGARSLSRGRNVDEQRANAQDTARRFFRANFKDNYWGCSVALPDPIVVEDNATKTRYVTVSANATSPLYFLRLIGKNTATVAVTAQARRRDVNIMLVLDRSGSMGRASPPALPTGPYNNHGQWPILNAAVWFVNQFAPGRDNLGLVTFGGSYYLANPTLDFRPAVVDDINAIYSNGGTSTAQALWKAYDALAHLPDQSGNPNGQPGALNVIIFFTDGRPNGLTADFINPVDLRNEPNQCALNAGSLRGWFTVKAADPVSNSGCNNPLNPHGGDSCVTGLFNYNPLGTVSDPHDAEDSERIAAPGCRFWTGDATDVYRDFNNIPSQDIYGNQTNPVTNRYQPVGQNRLNFPTEMNAAAANATDQAGQSMRAGAINGIIPRIYGIGLQTNNPGSNVPPPDHELMIRLSNVQQVVVDGVTYGNPIYDTSQPGGMYIFADNQSELQAAFQRIASEILRLSQ